MGRNMALRLGLQVFINQKFYFPQQIRLQAVSAHTNNAESEAFGRRFLRLPWFMAVKFYRVRQHKLGAFK